MVESGHWRAVLAPVREWWQQAAEAERRASESTWCSSPYSRTSSVDCADPQKSQTPVGHEPRGWTTPGRASRMPPMTRCDGARTYGLRTIGRGVWAPLNWGVKLRIWGASWERAGGSEQALVSTSTAPSSRARLVDQVTDSVLDFAPDFVV